MLSITDVQFAGGGVPNNPRAGVQNMAAFVAASTVIQTTNPREFVIPKGTWYCDYRGDPGLPAIVFQNVNRLICEGEIVFTGTGGSVRVTGQGMKVEGLNVKRPRTPARGSTWGNELLHLLDLRDSELIGTTTANSGASGLYIANCNGLEISEHHTINSMADGIHCTGGSANVNVKKSNISGCGDDYIAVVSPVAKGDGTPIPVCENITYDDIVGRGQNLTGRGIGVVGGKKIRCYDIDLDVARFAGIIVASESSYQTHASENVVICDVKIGEVLGKDGQASTGDGVIITGRAGFLSKNISIHGVKIDKVKRHGVLIFQNNVETSSLRHDVQVTTVGGQQVQLA